ncbi:MAG: hypothetical protein ACKOB8_04140 [Mycobacterium sp.]
MRPTGIGVACTLAAAALIGCSNPAEQNPAPAASSAQELPPAAPSAPPAAAPDPAALPPPEALADVIYRLADPAIPGADKMHLVADTTPPDADALNGFASALRDSGYTPLAVRASDLHWAPGRSGAVSATIVITTPNPAQRGEFTFPLEFGAHAGSWQLSRQSAEMLLAFDSAPPNSPQPVP